MLIDIEKAYLLVVDVQEKLAPALLHSEDTVNNIAWLLRLARRMSIPISVSEQYPKGLGHTVTDLQALIEDREIFEKSCFSCYADENFPAELKDSISKHIILCGMEAHVCVLQTAIELKHHGKDVYVVEEAVTSRTALSKRLALDRMATQGVQIVNREMVAFELLRRAGTDVFREISRDYIR